MRSRLNSNNSSNCSCSYCRQQHHLCQLSLMRNQRQLRQRMVLIYQRLPSQIRTQERMSVGCIKALQWEPTTTRLLQLILLSNLANWIKKQLMKINQSSKNLPGNKPSLKTNSTCRNKFYWIKGLKRHNVSPLLWPTLSQPSVSTATGTPMMGQ